jgi:hypothetical protein
LITGEWVELRTEINLDDDWFQFYYDDTLLIEKAWTAGPANQGDGFLVIDAVDLYANSATPVYYDDLSLEGEAVLPELEIESINGGFGVSAVIKNVGEGNATNVQWSIAFDGGIVIPKEKTGSIPILAPDDSENVKAIVFGFGKTTITVYAECAEGVSATGTVSGFVFLFFVLGVK